MLFILPEDFGAQDIENFKDAFMVKGGVTNGNEEVVGFLKRVSKCKDLDSWEKTYHFYDKDKQGKVVLLKIL